MNTWIPAIWIVGFGLLIVVSTVRARIRVSAIQKMAMRSGFRYVGDALPAVNLQQTPFCLATSVWNVIEGERSGIKVVAFDCRVGHGKGSWSRTAIAARTQTDVFNAVAFDRNLTVDHSGDWVVLYQPKQLVYGGLMRVEELEAHLNAIKP